MSSFRIISSKAIKITNIVRFKHNNCYSTESYKFINMSLTTIGTHSGSFHCDEVLACSMLKLLPEYKDSAIVRSRDLSVLKTCDIVVDVGGIYDPSTHRYDHHMREFKESLSSVIKKPGYDSEIKLSSAGLVYCHFGLKIIKQLYPELSEEYTEIVFKKIYDNLIKEIDGIDNGVPMFNEEPLYHVTTDLSSRVKSLNVSWNSKDLKEEEQFYKAMKMVGDEFLSCLESIVRIWLPARTLVHEAITNRFKIDQSGEIIEFEEAVPWKEHLFNIEKEINITSPIKFVIFKAESYRVQCVPVNPRSFICRKCLPESWAGLNDEALCSASQIDGCVFVHATRFIGGNKTREGAIKMAQKALR